MHSSFSISAHESITKRHILLSQSVHVYVTALISNRQSKLPKFHYRRSTVAHAQRTTAPIHSTRRLCSPLIKVKAPRRKRGKRRRKYAIRLARASDGPSRVRPLCIPRITADDLDRVPRFVYEFFSVSWGRSLLIANLSEVLFRSFFIFNVNILVPQC